MKKILLFSLILFAAFQAYSQETVKFRRGYVGISLGPTIHTGSPSGPMVVVPVSYGTSSSYQLPETPLLQPGSVGLTIHLVDAGYTFGKNWGIALKWQGGAYVEELNEEVFVSNFGMIMIGPMYSVQLQDDLFLDIKVRTGRMYAGHSFEGNGRGSQSELFSMGLEAGATLRYNFANRWASINNLEFQNQFNNFKHERINRINITSGVAFLF